MHLSSSPGRSIVLLVTVVLASCSEDRGAVPESNGENERTPSPYLYVWAGDADEGEGDQDFLAVVDADPESAAYGRVVTTTPVGSTGNNPHHAEPVAPGDGPLFANGFRGDRTFLFDLTVPDAPVLTGELAMPPDYNFFHSFLRMENGHVLTTAQEGGRDNPATVGGLVEYDANGVFVQSGSAAHPDFGIIRPYTVVLFPESDRALTSSFSMKLESSENLVQLWRLSDLTLLSTVRVPEIAPINSPACYFDEFVGGGDCTVDRMPGHDRTFEIRRLTDDSAILNTLACGFYGISGISGDDLEVEVIMNWGDSAGCGVTTMVAGYYIVPVAFSDLIVSVDVSDLSRPVQVSRAHVGEGTRPHWLQVDPNANRFIMTGNGPSGAQVQLYWVNPETGELTRDERFGDGDMGREDWPHGVTGPAAPHAALFGR